MDVQDVIGGHLVDAGQRAGVIERQVGGVDVQSRQAVMGAPGVGDLNGADPIGKKLVERPSQSTCHPVDFVLEVMVSRVAPLLVGVRSHEVFKAGDNMVGVQVGESHFQISPAFPAGT